MIPEIGNLCLILAFSLLLTNVYISSRAFVKDSAGLMSAGVNIYYSIYALVTLSYALLTVSFVQNDFSVAYVASNSSSLLPTYYRATATWAGHEGSMLLWVFFISVAMFVLHQQTKSFAIKARAMLLFIMNVIQLGFVGFILTTSSPFLRLITNMPHEGRDLNPLLQDIGFLIHPPILFLGYVGFSVVFAIAVSILLVPEHKEKLLRLMRTWTKIAWMLLTLGITLGSWWAYRELGWGGWWFWDPVENASFLPWLLGSALLHSVTLTVKRDYLWYWTLLLAMITFATSVLGTFLVRSGIITSVHSFAYDPNRGLYLLMILATYVGAGLLILKLKPPKASMFRADGMSKEGLIVLNSMLFFVCTVTVMLGTFYPLLHEAVFMEKISIGTPYYNTVMIPLFLPLLFLIGFAPHAKWGQNSIQNLLRLVKGAFVIDALLAILLGYLIFTDFSWLGVLGLWIVVWIVHTQLALMFSRTSGTPILHRTNLGMVISHMGVAILVLGITISETNGIKKQLLISTGDNITVNDYQLEMKEITKATGPNYTSTQIRFGVRKSNSPIDDMIAEQRIYQIQQMPLTEASIHTRWFSDLYISLGEPRGMSAWSVSIYYKPLVRFIWIGALIMIFGCMVSFRRKKKGKI